VMRACFTASLMAPGPGALRMMSHRGIAQSLCGIHSPAGKRLADVLPGIVTATFMDLPLAAWQVRPSINRSLC
jgi:hypothetical protein